MSEDTKRALAIVAPMAKELGVRISADRHYLYCNGQAIGIGGNSTYATVMEFVGYLILLWAKDRSEAVPKSMAARIRRYWYSDAQVKQFQRMREEAGYE